MTSEINVDVTFPVGSGGGIDGTRVGLQLIDWPIANDGLIHTVPGSAWTDIRNFDSDPLEEIPAGLYLSVDSDGSWHTTRAGFYCLSWYSYFDTSPTGHMRTYIAWPDFIGGPDSPLIDLNEPPSFEKIASPGGATYISYLDVGVSFGSGFRVSFSVEGASTDPYVLPYFAMQIIRLSD